MKAAVIAPYGAGPFFFPTLNAVHPVPNRRSGIFLLHFDRRFCILSL